MIELPNYKIIKKIASGGMGDVYLAEHTLLENKVAIKTLHLNLVNDKGFRKRFTKEAKIQSNLSHPNIVRLIDFQEQEDGLFLIMEYIDGKQLNDYIIEDSGPIPEDKLIPMFTQVLSAIKYAHSKGLVHRDIKPANILITPEGNAKVFDFGIAKHSDDDKGLTKTGVQLGTISYMSPEQVKAEKVDELSDIYSLGVTLFQMAVGKAPYTEQTNTFDVQLNIVSKPFPKARNHYPSVSDKLEAIIEKATQKNKSERFQNCEEFIHSFKATSQVVKEEKKPTKKEVKVKPIKKETVKLKPKKTLNFIISLFILTIFLSVFSFLLINSKLDEIQVLNKSLESEKRINNTYKLNIKELDNRVSELKNDINSLKLKLQTAVREAKVKSKIEATRAREEIERNERDIKDKREAIITSGEKENKDRIAKKEKKQLDELNRKYYPRAIEGYFFKGDYCPKANEYHFRITANDYVKFLYSNINDERNLCRVMGTFVKAKIRGKVGFVKTNNLIKKN